MSNKLKTEQFILLLSQLAKYRLQVTLPEETEVEITSSPISYKQRAAIRLHNILMRLRDEIHGQYNAGSIECSPDCVCSSRIHFAIANNMATTKGYTRASATDIAEESSLISSLTS